MEIEVKPGKVLISLNTISSPVKKKSTLDKEKPSTARKIDFAAFWIFSSTPEGSSGFNSVFESGLLYYAS